jgi:hypothetical protein
MRKPRAGAKYAGTNHANEAGCNLCSRYIHGSRMGLALTGNQFLTKKGAYMPPLIATLPYSETTALVTTAYGRMALLPDIAAKNLFQRGARPPT